MKSRVLKPRTLWRRASHRRQLRRLAGPKLLRALGDAYDDLFFIEIGANDGEQHDHLRPFIAERGWYGIMVEPVPYVFERLKRNYAGMERVVTANLAVAEHDGELPFYYVVEPDEAERAELPSWYDAIGSFSREVVVSHLEHIADIDARLVETHVRAVTFDTLCTTHSVSRVDLVVIDTEGYDAQIVRSIDLAAHRPRVLIYEHFHLTPADRDYCRRHLERAGYETMEEGFDTFCFDPSPDDSLTATWRRLRPAVRGVSIHDPAS